MKLLKNDLVPFLSRKEIEVFVSRLASQIEDDYRGRDLVLVCPLRGSIHFVTDLSRKLSLPLRIDFVYLRAVEKGGAIKIMKD
ncbi:MAG TPA: phosphoribosyltransferase family protein, partial [Pseudobdellovibrionaceae bacterium]|nr:phosphoribosyltransferase family protein [Pseudobdellovibrionaceae bacterium]